MTGNAATFQQFGGLPARIQKYDRNLRGRDYTVGDVHGAFSSLQSALDEIAFDPACDCLFSVGDLVDRGPESANVLCWLRKPWFFAVCGNHDLMCWKAALQQPFAQVAHADHGGEWLQRLAGPEQRRIGEALHGLPFVIEVDTADGPVGVVHADYPSDDWRDVELID